VDINAEKVQMMKDGKVPIYEPHLDVLFERNIRQGRLRFTTDLAEALEKAQIVFLALPTPPGEDGSADLSYVLKAAGDIGRLMKDYKVLVDKSTVPVGTAEKVHAEVAKYAKVEFDVVSNPEFLREGFAVDDFLKPDRVVVGTSSERARKLMEDLYKPFVRQGNPIIFMDERSAELTKYAANAFLAAKITFMNEIANFCEAVGADVDKVRIGMGTDTRIGKRFLFPGIGYGGSCFPKDVQALAKSGKEAGYDFQIINSVMEVNEQQKTALMPKIEAYYGGDLKGKHFAMWGLSFKPDTDDIREAPALYMIDALTKAGATVTAFDPEGANNVKKLIGDKINYAKDEYEALKGADSLIICTEWALFRTPDFAQLESSLKERTIFDGRNLYELDEMKAKGFHYVSIGRNVVTAAHSPKAKTKATA
jgi:UDPglucose 6-dehydrogenase